MIQRRNDMVEIKKKFNSICMNKHTITYILIFEIWILEKAEQISKDGYVNDIS